MGLVSYDSSDEDEEVQTSVDVQPPKPAVTSQTSNTPTAPTPKPTTATSSSTPTHPAPPAADPPALGPVLGPTFGPSRPPTTQDTSQQDPSEIDLAFLSEPTPQGEAGTDGDATEPPRSPYTRTRTLLHNLTLPAVPNMDIPPSPPGSPPPGLDALTAKFDTFLRLKRTRGAHFNERLARSAGMANPAVADKLLGFVGVGTEFGGDADADGGGEGGGGGDVRAGGRGVEQYATVLSAEVWDPACFPAWAYRGPLRKAQERGVKERERGRGEAVEFVAASAGGGGGVGGAAAVAVGGSGTGSAAGSRSGTPGVGGGSARKKGRWDT